MGKGIFLVGADGRRDVGTFLLIQRGVDDRAVLQAHLGTHKNKDQSNHTNSSGLLSE